MGSLFGGAQTVNQNQFTTGAGSAATNYTNNINQVQAANALAQGSGQNVLNYSNLLASQGPGNVPLQGFAPLSTQGGYAINNPFSVGNTASSVAAQSYNPALQTGLYNQNQGAGLAGQAGTPISQQDIGSFFNPFAANVTANLQDIFGQQNTQNLLGSTQAAGGVGSERSAVGQALLAQRQQLTAGNIYADLYQRSLQAAEQQKAQQLASAQALTGAGTAQGQLGLGTVSAANQANATNLPAAQWLQQLMQQPYSALYQQQQQQYQDPFQRLGSLTGTLPGLIGLGYTGQQGGTGQANQQTSNIGTGLGGTTYPAPSIGGQIAGLGLLGAAFLKRGGRVRNPYHFQDGGSVDDSLLTDVGGGGTGGEAAPLGLSDQGMTQGADQTQTQTQEQQQPPQQQQGQQQAQNPFASQQFKQNLNRQLQQAQKAFAQKLIMQKYLRPHPIQMPQQPWMLGGSQAIPQIAPTMQGFDDGGRVAYLNPKDEETESQAHAKLLPSYGLSKAANPYFNAGDKNNIARDMMDPGTKYPMTTGNRYPMSTGEAGLYADGGAVSDDDEAGGEAAPLGGASPMAQAALQDDDDDDVGGEAAPLGGAHRLPTAQVNQVLSPYDTGVNPSVGAPGPSAGGMSPGKLALLQAGLGMMAASGQRDRHGLPMSPLAAIGQGGMQGVNTYQKQQVLAQRERASQAALGLRKAQMENLERYRKEHLDLQRGMQPGQLKTIQTPMGPRSVIVQPDGSFKDAYSNRPISSGENTQDSSPPAMVDTGNTDEQKENSSGLMGQVKSGQPLFNSPHRPNDKNFEDLLDSMQMNREQFDFLAARYALGDSSVLQGSGNRQAGVAFRRAIQSRANQYFMDRGYGPQEANNAIVEFQAQKAGARSLANQQGRITGALARAEQTAPVVVGLSDKINRTEYPTLNKLILAAKRHTGDEDTIRYGLAMETFISNYASATGQGNSVMTDHQRGVMEKRLDEAYSKGQIKSVIDQGMIEINRELRGTQHGMDYYLGRRMPGEENENRGMETGSSKETTKEEYNKLPSGAHYFKDGKEYIKK